MRNLRRVGILLAALSCLHVETARASFHLMMVVQVFAGYASAPNAQFVELQMYAPDQNFVMGQSVQVYDSTGGLVGTFPFFQNVSNGTDQSTVLVATTDAQALFGVVPDAAMDPVLSPAGGKVCYTGSNDCVSWGDFSGSSIGVGNPFSPGGLPPGMSAQRRLDRGTPGVLDPADDTDDSATDFVLAPPTPRNNSGGAGATAGYGSTPPPSGTIAFGSTTVGSSVSATLEVFETGGETLTVSNPVLGGPDRLDFSVDTAFPLSLPDGSPPVDVHLGCTPHAPGARTATLTLATNDPARTTVVYQLACSGHVGPPALEFFAVAPCRVVDTRRVGGPVAAGTNRTFAIAGACGVPPTARAVSLNVTVTEPTSAGDLRVFPAGSTGPDVSTVNYSAGQTRANNAIVGLADDGRLTVGVAPSGSAQVILDVNGYFE